MKNKRFTILEVVIAGTLLSIMMVLLIMTTSNMYNRWNVVLRNNEEFEELLNIEQVLDNSMPNAIPFVWRKSDDFAKREHVFLGEQNRIAFAYLHQLQNLEGGALTFIGFQVEDNELVCYIKRRPFLNLDTNLNSDDIERNVIARQINNINLEYAVSKYDGAGNEEIEWESSWDNRSNKESEERFDIPLAFKITINWINGNSETFLYRTSGNSQFARHGSWDYDRIGAGSSSSSSDQPSDPSGPPPGPGGGGGPPSIPGGGGGSGGGGGIIQ